ncbi:MAG TPA: PAS domain-containing protein, partial [Rariglobus sp.]
MNSSVTNPSFNETAFLVLDAKGTVRSANAAAGRIWEVSPADLAGQLVVSLFAFEITSNDPGWRESQWEVLIATALGRPLVLQAQPFEPVAPVDVRIELQAAHGLDAAYFARIEIVTPPPASPAPSPDAKSAVAFAETGADLLAARGPLGFFDLDLTTGRVVTSPAWKRMLGYIGDELPDTHEAWCELIHPDDTGALPDRVARAPLSGHRDFSVEFRLRHHDGHYVWVHSSGIQLFDSSRTLQRVIGVNTDISERKEAEDSGFTCEERLERLADLGRLAVFDFDFAALSHWISPAGQALAGHADSTPAPDTLLSLLPAEVAQQGIVAFLSTPSPGEAFFTQAITLRIPGGGELP